MCIIRYMKKRKMGGEFVEFPGLGAPLLSETPSSAVPPGMPWGRESSLPLMASPSLATSLTNRDAVAVAMMKESPTTITEGSVSGGEAWW